MARTKTSQTQTAKALDAARATLKDARAKFEKTPNNEMLEKAFDAAKTRVRELSIAVNRERFLKVGGARVSKALKAIAALRMVANQRSYSFSEPDVQKIEEAVGGSTKMLLEAFRDSLKPEHKKASDEPEFSFD